MASGQPIAEIATWTSPGSSYATWSVLTGGSSPAEQVLTLDFDASTAEYAYAMCRLSPNYVGGGLTVKLPWSAKTATSGDTRWGVAIRRVNLSSENVTSSQTYDYNYAATTAPGTVGLVVETTITFTSGADMDSLAAGELFILAVVRDAANGADTMTGDARLWAYLVAIRET